MHSKRGMKPKFFLILSILFFLCGFALPAHADTLSGPYKIWDLGSLQSDPLFPDESRAFDVNDNNEVVGSSMVDGITERAFIWDATLGMRDLGTLENAGIFSRAFIINNNGVVVGDSTNAPAGLPYSFIWKNGAMTYLGGPLAILTDKAYDLNDDDVVVGPDKDSPLAALIFDASGAFVDLDTLIPSTSEQGDKFTDIIEATGINNNGCIVGSGYIESGGWHAFLLAPDKTDYDGDGISGWDGDCDDNDATVYPGAVEICDGKDNNCDGQIDEGVQTTWYLDGDADGYSEGTSFTGCAQPANYYLAADLTAPAGDCDDAVAAVNPAAAEACNGIDDNCDGSTDEGVTTRYYQDADSDGFGNSAVFQDACAQPAGFVLDDTDCDDTNGNEFPGQTWYKDADGDGYSNGDTLVACEQPANHFLAADLTAPAGDCDDAVAAVNPAAAEACNGIDDNCDGSTDEGLTVTYYEDLDGDGFGNPAVWLSACAQPFGYSPDNTDCDDTDADEYPGKIWYADADNDGFGDPSVTLTQCEKPVGYVANNTDNCPGMYNPDQIDSDGDGYGDACGCDLNGDNKINFTDVATIRGLIGKPYDPNNPVHVKCDTDGDLDIDANDYNQWLNECYVTN